MFKLASSFADGGSQNIKLTSAIAEYICIDNQPFSTVEGRGFLNLMRTICPKYKMPARNSIKAVIDRKFETFTMTVVRPHMNPSIAVANAWVKTLKESVRPWSKFLDVRQFHVPQTFPKCTSRVVRNVEYFQSNYFLVFVALVVYCVLTSPLLLIAIAACLGALYIIRLKNLSKEVTILGVKLSLAHQYAAVSVVSFPLFYVAGAGQVVFWILGASFFTIMLHATLYAIEDISEDEETFDLQMEPV